MEEERSEGEVQVDPSVMDRLKSTQWTTCGTSLFNLDGCRANAHGDSSNFIEHKGSLEEEHLGTVRLKQFVPDASSSGWISSVSRGETTSAMLLVILSLLDRTAVASVTQQVARDDGLHGLHRACVHTPASHTHKNAHTWRTKGSIDGL